MAKSNNDGVLGKVISDESEGRDSKFSEVIKTTELSSLESKKGNFKTVTSESPYKRKSVELIEDCFGLLHGTRGPPQQIKRFTWKNHNNIEVQVITYGARITSIKLPNRKGVVDDVVVGCGDLAGYLQYSGFFLGATIGRVTDIIGGSTFVIDGVQYWVHPNDGQHQRNGGMRGFDKVVWQSYLQGNKVILSHTSMHGDEGLPGDLLVTIGFELSSKNEFTINIEAVTTKPTVLNLSNLVYFNLAGHQAGPQEVYKHVVTINANCYTVSKQDGPPTGEIMNVVYTKNDLQIPTVLKTRIGVEPGDGYDQNFCVNRGVDQGNCFVARALHGPSGRILEVYSNQYGVRFLTANHFGSGLVDLPVKTKDAETKTEEPIDNIFVLLDTLYAKVADLDYNESNDLEAVRDLLKRIQKCDFEPLAHNPSVMLHAMNVSHPDSDATLKLSEVELNYLRHIRHLAERVRKTTSRQELQRIVEEIFNATLALDKVTSSLSLTTQTKKTMASGNSGQSKGEISGGIKSKVTSSVSFTTQSKKTMESGNGHKSKDGIFGDESQRRKPGASNGDRGGTMSGSEKVLKAQVLDDEGLKSHTDTFKIRKAMSKKLYNDGRFHGKNGAIYERHGAISFQTQNYPNAMHHSNFPSCVLHPGDTYSHTIVYKFWIQGSNPKTWKKRNCS